MKTIYFIRHGETQANVDQLIAGAELESPLTEKGRDQAKKAGQKLRDKYIEIIVSSPMERTQDTAKIIAKEIGYDPDKIIIDEAFVEVSNKFYSGKPYALVDQHTKEGKLIEDIEHPDKVMARVKAGFERIKKLPAERILLVSHGATGRMIRAVAENIPHHDFMSHQRFENAGIYKFELP